MSRSAPFRLNRSALLLALVSAAFAAQQAQAAAGRVEFAHGAATVTGADGRTRALARGVELDNGDVVRTQQDGRVQVRMTDGAFISLQPNTEFGIRNYRYEGRTDGTENAFFSLLKGAMRLVTGAVGRVNRDKFVVSTPTATVGIRGTGGLIRILLDTATLVRGTSGIWFLANPAGTIDVPAGVSGVAPSDPKDPPKETADIPTAGPAPLPPQEEYVQGDQREPDGQQIINLPASTVLVSGSGFAAAIAYGARPSAALQPFIDSGSASAMFNGAGQMTQAELSGGTLVFEMQSGTHADFGTDGILAWGRWTGQVAVPRGVSPTETYNSNQGLHYVVGMPTPSMPTSGLATYNLLGATQPTYLDGRTTPGTLTAGSLSVDFGKFTVGTTLDIAMPDATYSIRGNSSISGAFFFGQTGSGLTVTGSTCCLCSARVDGFFAGTSAERAGLAYHINESLSSKDVLGAAAFKK